MDLDAVKGTARGYAWMARTALRGFGLHSGTPRRHLLLLAWLFPPRISGGVYRPAALARYARERGWDVTVITGPAPADPDAAGRYMLDYVGQDVRVLEVPDGEFKTSYRAFPRVDGGFQNALKTFDLAMENLAEDPPGVVLASGPPFHNFIAARYLGRAFGVPYVLDYRDEWTECPFDFVQKGNMDRRYERACLRRAEHVIFTTESLLDHQAAVFPELDRARCSVIPNGWEPSDLDAEAVAPPLPPASLRIAFVGLLGDHSLPAIFLSTLARVLEDNPALKAGLRITFVGQKSPGAREQLAAFPYQENLELLDHVSKPAALAVMRSVDGLLLLNDVGMHRYRPGKLYDYLAMGTPLLVHGDGGEIAALVRRFDAGRIIHNGDPAAMAEALTALSGLRGRSVKLGVRDWLALHTRSALAEQTVDLLDELVGSQEAVYA